MRLIFALIPGLAAIGLLSACQGRTRPPRPAPPPEVIPEQAGVQSEPSFNDPLLRPVSSDEATTVPPRRPPKSAEKESPAASRPITPPSVAEPFPAPAPDFSRGILPPVSSPPNIPEMPRDTTLDDLLFTTEREQIRHPGDATVRKRLAQLYVLAGRYPEAAKAFEGVDLSGDEFARLTYAALMNRLGEDSKASATLEAVRRGWRNAHDLHVATASFTQGVIRGFRSYTPIERAAFVRGSQGWIYVELENFTSRRMPNGRYQIALRVDFAIHDSAGRTVPWPDLARYKKDFRQEQIDDFNELHLPLLVIFPKDLSPGRYTMEILLRDEVSEKRTDVSLPFSIQ